MALPVSKIGTDKRFCSKEQRNGGVRVLTLQGKGASGGVVVGRARLLKYEEIKVKRDTAADPRREWERYEEARARTVEELEGMFDDSCRTLGAEQADIFRVHAMMAQDEDFNEAVRRGIIEDRYRAEYALMQAKEQFEAQFSEMEDEYMRERAGDIRDVAARILGHVRGQAASGMGHAAETYILCAQDLTPSQTVNLDRRAVLAFVTAKGSTNSHSAILARSMKLPAVVDVGDELLARVVDGTMLAVDGERGLIYVDPDEGILREWEERAQAAQAREAQLLQYRNRESRTSDGRRIEICANVGSPEEVQEAILEGADGIGLFRSEFLYLGRQDYPDEEEQFRAYRRALTAMPGKRVIIRTLDIGADKQAAYFGLAQEENPALGMRACRVSLARPEVFLTQARALLRASAFGRLAVMFPLITDTREVEQLLSLWNQAKRELEATHVAYADEIEIGIMIETPAAAIISDRLAPLVDFFSIGTNDLTQYTLAMDRQNAALAGACQGRHESVMRLIRYTVESARRAGIWVGICGELGADLSLTEAFLHMGVTELSVSPGAILSVRERVCTLPTVSNAEGIDEGMEEKQHELVEKG